MALNHIFAGFNLYCVLHVPLGHNLCSSSDLQKPEVKSKLMALKKKSRYLWVALEESANSWEQECTDLGFTNVNF